MKAKEYAAKYEPLFRDAITDPERYSQITAELFNELRDEMFTMFDIRHIRRKESFESLVKEFNVKGNRINELCHSPLKRDWYLRVIERLMNEAEKERKEKQE